jgi:rare lipoprotein A
MSAIRHEYLFASALLISALGLGASGCTRHNGGDAVTPPQAPATPVAPEATAKLEADRSGRTRVGVASYYADRFAGREMADGTPMDPGGDNAASRTLPLGTTAKVTNISTGESANVTIQDRGPYAKGRLLDLSPATAQKIGITRNRGVARVSVAPIKVPLPDGTIKSGAAANDPEALQRH